MEIVFLADAKDYCQEFIDAFKMEFDIRDIRYNKDAKNLKNKIDSINRRIIKGSALIQKVLSL